MTEQDDRSDGKLGDTAAKSIAGELLGVEV